MGKPTHSQKIYSSNHSFLSSEHAGAPAKVWAILIQPPFCLQTNWHQLQKPLSWPLKEASFSSFKWQHSSWVAKEQCSSPHLPPAKDQQPAVKGSIARAVYFREKHKIMSHQSVVYTFQSTEILSVGSSHQSTLTWLSYTHFEGFCRE